jgi:type IX secretion system PorP/SprF family membrane protein
LFYTKKQHHRFDLLKRMRQFKNTCLSILFLLLIKSSFAQDPNFSQFLSTKVYYNPANVGSREGMEINLDVRKNWMVIPNSPQSYLVTLDKSFWNLKGVGGMGLLVLNNIEGAGALSTMILGLPISSRIRLTEKFTTQLAIMPQYQMKRINWGELVFSDQLDPIFGKVLQQSPSFNYDAMSSDSFIDLGYGILVTFESHPEKENKSMNSVINAGFSVSHVPEPKMSFLGMSHFLSSKIVVHFDGRFPLKEGYYRRESINLMPGFIYEKQGAFSSYMLGLSLSRNPLIIGFWIRNKNFNPKNTTDLIFMFGYQFGLNKNSTSRVSVFYTYDSTVSKLNNHDSGSHEIGIRFNFDDFFIFNECESCKDDRWIFEN